jgi:signal transduction histidine kinase
MITASLMRFCLPPVVQSLSRWQGVNFLHKIAAAVSLVLLIGTVFVAAMIARHAGEAIKDRYGAEVALYTDSFVAPLVQELATRSTISEGTKKELDNLFSPTVIGRPIVGFRIWADNQIIYSNSQRMIGERFPGSPSRTRAWRGGVSAELNELDGDDDVQIRALGVPILEVYAPLRQIGTGRIIALAETYEIANDLAEDVTSAQASIWLIFASSAALIIFLLFVLAGRGASELGRLGREKDEVRERVGSANRRVSEMNELHMQQVGSELYRGPAQLVGVALLKLDSLPPSPTDAAAQARSGDVEVIRSALTQALEEIRNLSKSLVPSSVYERSLAETIGTAVRRHERHTDTAVLLEITALPAQIPFSVRTCAYGFVREALEKGCAGTDANAVRVECCDDLLAVQVTAKIGAEQVPPSHNQQWLRTCKDRVESIGGELLVKAMPGAVSYTAKFNIHELEVMP